MLKDLSIKTKLAIGFGAVVAIILTLLAVEFEETAPPAGVVTLFFAGGPVLRLEVECLEAELADLGPSWATVAGSALAEARG